MHYWPLGLSWSWNFLNPSIQRLPGKTLFIPFHPNWGHWGKVNLHWNVNGGRNTFELKARYHIYCKEAKFCETLKCCHSFWETWWSDVGNSHSETCLVDVSLILCKAASYWWNLAHSLIISREVLILTLSIFNALKVCISWYSLATGLKSEATTYKDHVIRYSPCALGSVQRNTSLGTVFPRTLPRESIGNTSSRGNIDNAPAMM